MTAFDLLPSRLRIRYITIEDNIRHSIICILSKADNRSFWSHLKLDLDIGQVEFLVLMSFYELIDY